MICNLMQLQTEKIVCFRGKESKVRIQRRNAVIASFFNENGISLNIALLCKQVNFWMHHRLKGGINQTQSSSKLKTSSHMRISLLRPLRGFE